MSIEVKLTFISRIIALLAIAFCASATISIMTIDALWLAAGLFTIGAILGIVGWIVPGILIILGRPNLAYAWLDGVHPSVYTRVPWGELTSHKRRSVYFESMIPLVFVIAFDGEEKKGI